MVEIANNVPDGLSDEVTGATVNAYASAISWPCLGFGRKTITIENTDAANTLKYKLLCYAYEGGTAHEEVAETTLAIGDDAKITLENPWAVIILQVKSAVPDSHADYAIDYNGVEA
jgi:hypothetical protein